jgi:hypothetical protein
VQQQNVAQAAAAVAADDDDDGTERASAGTRSEQVECRANPQTGTWSNSKKQAAML